jgi:hypothetical protein
MWQQCKQAGRRPDGGHASIAASACWFFLAGVLWLGANPYIGIDHDARLYTFMAVRWLTPAAYARDPWFAHGSQDDWSLFSPAYAVVLELFGVEAGALLTTIMGGLLFVLASVLLAKSLLRGRLAWLAALLLVSVPLCYSPKGMLFVSESFATARAFAVPLSMMALALGARGRARGALALHALAMLLHPSMALAPSAITVLAMASPRASALIVLGGSFAAALLLLAGALGRVSVVDGDWLMFAEPAVLVFIGPWVRSELTAILAPIVLLLIAHRHGVWRMRRLYGTTALVASLSVLFSLLAGERMPVTLVMQAQFWRALWIANVVAVVAFADLAGRFVLRRRAPSRLPLLGVLVPLASLLAPGGLLLLAWAGLQVGGRVYWQWFTDQVLLHRRLVQGLLILIVAVQVPVYLLSLSLASAAADSGGGLTDVVIGLLRTGGSGALALAVFLAACRWQPRVLAVLALPLLVFSLWLWDERSPTQKHWESRYSIDGSRRMFAAHIERGRTVYWHDAAPRVWLELGTAGYASTTHATGLVFSRERTRVLDARLTRVAIRTLTADQARLAAANGMLLDAALRGAAGGAGEVRPYVLASYEATRPSTPFGIGYLCRDKDLDFVIDPVNIEGMSLAEEAERIDGRRVVNHLYDCAMFRAGTLPTRPRDADRFPGVSGR